LLGFLFLRLLLLIGSSIVSVELLMLVAAPEVDWVVVLVVQLVDPMVLQLVVVFAVLYRPYHRPVVLQLVVVV
jgi:hypothetical protein